MQNNVFHCANIQLSNTEIQDVHPYNDCGFHPYIYPL